MAEPVEPQSSSKKEEKVKKAKATISSVEKFDVGTFI
jgi:hypothetical protein